MAVADRLASRPRLALAAPVPALGWAAARLGPPSLAWAQPAQGALAFGFGVAESVEAHTAAEVRPVLEALASPEGAVRWEGPAPLDGVHAAWFGGLAFDPQADAWPDFPATRWIRPGALYAEAAGEALLIVHGFQDERDALAARLLDLQGSLARIRAEKEPLPAPDRAPAPVEEDEPGYRGLVDQALHAIRGGTARKIVAARAIHLAAAERLDPVESLERLARRLPQSTLFLLRSAKGTRCFLGATPERLCDITGTHVETEALAGTAPALGREGLTRSEKDGREHRSVVSAITEALSPLCDALDVAREPQLHAYGDLVHLRTPIRACLTAPERAVDAVLALHPTPAVGGEPRAAALAFLRAHEGFTRGWYAGAIGWLGPQVARFRVAIRSALVEGERAQVFVGAGIVEGSTPEGEWHETVAKSTALLQALGATR